jgi:hypothetical protein
MVSLSLSHNVLPYIMTNGNNTVSFRPWVFIFLAGFAYPLVDAACDQLFLFEMPHEGPMCLR